MRRSTKVISLSLISSSLILAGCQQRAPEDTARGGGHGTRYHSGTHIITGGGGTSTTPGSSTHGGGTVSPRGGFGGAGHAAGGGGS